jgi:hypothetical protein
MTIGTALVTIAFLATVLLSGSTYRASPLPVPRAIGRKKRPPRPPHEAVVSQ